MAFRSAKLEKLTIRVFKDRARRQMIDTLRVMFNPTSFTLSFQNSFDAATGADSTGPSNGYTSSTPRTTTLDLVFDGTGVAIDAVDVTGIAAHVEAFLRSTMFMNGSIHEPNYLRVQWGDGPLQNFDCRMTRADVTYKLFDRSGAPLRADLKVTIQEDLDDPKRHSIEGKQSPDLTHARLVRTGDTLPLLCKEIYGSSRHYLRVARANGLDDFRQLVPGSVLRFPPLAK